jgi:DNA-binding transcriptional LysR family regulator
VLTAAGEELLNEGRRLLAEIDAVANRVQARRHRLGGRADDRVDDAIARPPSSSCARPSRRSDGRRRGGRQGAATRLRLRTEVMSGTWEALVSGQADLAIGTGSAAARLQRRLRAAGRDGLRVRGRPHHPLADAAEPLSDAQLASTASWPWPTRRSAHEPLTVNLLPGRTC